MKHTFSLLVENTFGAFDRVATLFSAKGFNLHSISIGETEIRDISRMTIVISGEAKVVEQAEKQLNRLVDTVKVVDLTKSQRVERELALISVNYKRRSLEEIKNICDVFRGKVVDINNKTITLEVTGPPAKMEAIVNVLSPFGIIEMARSGTVALKRGEQQKAPQKEYLHSN
ncbi:acetolactate synthase small subunit [candidate division KSB1 bacterium]|nr:acetolactate synthase small subunit [candidate division KSB1 bacterium]MBL7093360.1 acetolactate synthase small subunit [candidate division KSB1 bacterium]